MIVLSGADLVLPDRILSPGTLVIDGDRIVDVRAGVIAGGAPHPSFAFHGHHILPGFIDVHIHGVGGVDALDGVDAVGAIAARLPQYGVTAFCPTSVACAPDALRMLLTAVRDARAAPPRLAARVLPAHLESNFISAEYRGAQPARCLRLPRGALDGARPAAAQATDATTADATDFTGVDIIAEIERAAPDVGIVTLAPELEGAIDLIGWLRAHGQRVSLGHSGASFDEGVAAIAAGASQATHLFNRMPPLGHRTPGLVGAILQSDEVASELICDGFHVHPAVVGTTIAAKRPSRVMAISDSTAASGLPLGGRASLGGQPISAGPASALLDDGTVAGSVLTMDRAFRMLIGQVGLSLPDAVALCATTPARELGLVGHGLIAPGSPADVVVLDAQLAVVQTYVAGQLVYSRDRVEPG